MPLIARESTTPAMLQLLNADEQMVVSALTIVEAASALARRHRESPDDRMIEMGRSLLRDLRRNWDEVAIDDDVRRIAIDLLYRRSLKASDALQLASALHARSARGDMPFLTLDSTLAVAARTEGLQVQP